MFFLLLGFLLLVLSRFFLKKSGHPRVHALQVDLRDLVIAHIFNVERSDWHLLRGLFSGHIRLSLRIFLWLDHRLNNHLLSLALIRIFYFSIPFCWWNWINLDRTAFSDTSVDWFFIWRQKMPDVLVFTLLIMPRWENDILVTRCIRGTNEPWGSVRLLKQLEYLWL